MRTKATWQQQLASAIRDPHALLQHLKLTDQIKLPDPSATTTFACRAPLPYVNRIEKGNPHDPLLKQILPLNEELIITPGYSYDPLHELQQNPIEGLLHKYHGRVLITLTGACAIHCRYCFRRHFPYQNHSLSNTRWQKILSYLKQEQTIHEVILSGGDPLTLKDAQLQQIVTDLNALPNITTVRFHSRLPIVIPSRITDTLCQTLSSTRLRCVMVIHCNHANEIDPDVKNALAQLQQHRVSLLNQSVLLKGINDSLGQLTALSHALHQAHVLPYYLHLTDATQGTAHFTVEKPQALLLIDQLRQQLPGYLVPRLAQEEPFKEAKTILF